MCVIGLFVLSFGHFGHFRVVLGHNYSIMYVKGDNSWVINSKSVYKWVHMISITNYARSICCMCSWVSKLREKKCVCWLIWSYNVNCFIVPDTIMAIALLGCTKTRTAPYHPHRVWPRWSCYLISIVYFKLLISLTCTDLWQRIVVIFFSNISKDMGARPA